MFVEPAQLVRFPVIPLQTAGKHALLVHPGRLDGVVREPLLQLVVTLVEHHVQLRQVTRIRQLLSPQEARLRCPLLNRHHRETDPGLTPQYLSDRAVESEDRSSRSALAGHRRWIHHCLSTTASSNIARHRERRSPPCPADPSLRSPPAFAVTPTPPAWIVDNESVIDSREDSRPRPAIWQAYAGLIVFGFQVALSAAWVLRGDGRWERMSLVIGGSIVIGLILANLAVRFRERRTRSIETSATGHSPE